MSVTNIANLEISLLKISKTTTAKELDLLCLTQCFPNLVDHKSLFKNNTKSFTGYCTACVLHHTSSEILFCLATYCLVLTPAHLTMFCLKHVIEYTILKPFCRGHKGVFFAWTLSVFFLLVSNFFHWGIHSTWVGCDIFCLFLAIVGPTLWRLLLCMVIFFLGM